MLTYNSLKIFFNLVITNRKKFDKLFVLIETTFILLLFELKDTDPLLLLENLKEFHQDRIPKMLFLQT